ncbi:MAG: hypothetical protein GF330_05875, partial [Candidatus Eisenbacteria bacterium]|nr:hypothetical protein [Candidatus Eisenbacteria bacterium]
MDSSGTPKTDAPVQPERIAPLEIAWLLSPLLYLLLRWSAFFLPDPLRAALAFLLVVLLPGWLLHLLILPRARIGLAARITRAFFLGVGSVALLGLLAWFAGGDVGLGSVTAERMPPAPFVGRLSSLVWSQPLFLLLLAIAHLWRRQRRRRAARASQEQPGEEAGARAAPRAGAILERAEKARPAGSRPRPALRRP